MTKQELVEVVKSFLDSIEWKYEYVEESTFFDTGSALDGAMDYARIIIDVDDDVVQCFTITKASAEKESVRSAVSEFIARANYGLKLGTFELDWNDGEIRYRSYIDCEGGASPTKPQMENLLYVGPAMFERYGENLLAVINGEKTPAQAVADAEAQKS